MTADWKQLYMLNNEISQLQDQEQTLLASEINEKNPLKLH